MSTAATSIREAIIERLARLQTYRKIRRTPAPQIQPKDFPILSVFIGGERMRADGDANAGEPSFLSDIMIGISVVGGFHQPDDLDDELDTQVNEIEATLLTDPDFISSGLFEGIEDITRRRLFPNSGETYFAELRLEMTFQARVSYPPVIRDDYRGATLRARPLGSTEATPAAGATLPQTT